MTDWYDRAACRGADTELFFPASANPLRGRRSAEQLTATARRYCSGCPVIAECSAMARETRSKFCLLGGAWWPDYGQPVALVAAAEVLVGRAS